MLPAATKARRPVVLGRGTARFAGPGRRTLAVKPTRAGKAALRGKRAARVILRTTFRPASGAKAIVVTSRAVQL